MFKLLFLSFDYPMILIMFFGHILWVTQCGWENFVKLYNSPVAAAPALMMFCQALACLYVLGVLTRFFKENKHKTPNKSCGVPYHQWCLTHWTCQMCFLMLALSLSLCLCTLNHQRGDGSSSSCVSVSEDHLLLSGRSRSLTDENRPTSKFCSHTSLCM